LIRKEILFPVFWTIIHEPGGDNNIWPAPACNWEFIKGKMLLQREDRYTPWEVLRPPVSMKDPPSYYFLPAALWTTADGHPAKMRDAMDQYHTGIGAVKSDGSPVPQEYQGWLDRNGYLLSFIKRNHLFWLAPFPDLTNYQDGACRKVLSIYPLGNALSGIDAKGMEGNCSCQSELFPGKGITVGSGVGDGSAWFEFGPVFQDSVKVIIHWNDNSWRQDQKRLEVFNWRTSAWETIASLLMNDGKNREDRFRLLFRPEIRGPLHQIRIRFSGAKNARAHLESIEVR
jgi:hypothetical protein